MSEWDKNLTKGEVLKFIDLSSASSKHRLWVRAITLGTIVFRFLVLGFKAFWMNCWFGVFGPLEGFIRELDGIGLSCELSGVFGTAGDRTWGELTLESLLVLLTRFQGSVVGAARRGSIGNGRECSFSSCAELPNFWIRCSIKCHGVDP